MTEHKKTKKELEESLMRVTADYANYRRRTEEERELTKKRCTEQLVKELLTVVDSLQLALTQTPIEQRGEFYKGVELTLAQLLTTLEDAGLEPIQLEKFEPTIHEAILTETSEEPKDTILEVLQPGYKLGGIVIRTAKVKLSSGGNKK